MGWSEGILTISLVVTDDSKAVKYNLIENYGMITLEQVTECKLPSINEQGCEAQDTYMMYMCLMDSLSSSAKKKVSTLTCAVVWLCRKLSSENATSTQTQA